MKMIHDQSLLRPSYLSKEIKRTPKSCDTIPLTTLQIGVGGKDTSVYILLCYRSKNFSRTLILPINKKHWWFPRPEAGYFPRKSHSSGKYLVKAGNSLLNNNAFRLPAHTVHIYPIKP
jgi:hypothetical protein